MKRTETNLTIITLGGVEQIGRHCTLIKSGKNILMLDCGLSFSQERHLGVVKEIINIDKIRNRIKNIDGILVTHGHEDHIGGIAWTMQQIQKYSKKMPKIYASPLTLVLIKKKCNEYGIDIAPYCNPILGGEKTKIGAFYVNAFDVAHSMPQSLAFGININGYKIFATGDFKMENDPERNIVTDIRGIKNFCKNGIDVMMSDSTNAVKDGFCNTEKDVYEAFDNLFQKRKTGRFFITMFSSHIRRIFTILNLAEKYGKKVCLMGSSLVSGYEMAKEVGLAQAKNSVICSLEESLSVPHEKIIYLCTGCQGEAKTIMEKLSNGRHEQLHVGPGDTVVFSSSVIPGNDASIGAVINKLMRKNVTVFDKGFHSSGHGYAEDLKQMISIVNPKHFIPVHGEYRHIHAHAKLAIEVGVDYQNIHLLENGSFWTLQDDQYSIGKDEDISNMVFLDGQGHRVGAREMSERRKIAMRGVVVISIVVSKTKKPEFAIATAGKMIEYSDVNRVLQSAFPDIANPDLIANDVVNTLGQYFFEVLGTRPEIITTVVSVR